MAKTKPKRRTKHRGTAAGTIQTRGRTGRPLSKEEKRKQVRAAVKEQRLNTPPTWSQSMKRALLAAGLMFIFLLLTARGKNRIVVAVGFAVFALLIYIPAGYYMELFLFRRRQRKKAAAK